MNNIAQRPIKERADLFRATGQLLAIHEAVIEKDFWVCWILDFLFQESPWKNSIAFKGGTSLSKAYGLIERFSEDIDIILNWNRLGYSNEEPWEERSATQQARFGETANRKTADFLNDEMAPALETALSDRLKAHVEVKAEDQIIRFVYPRAFSLKAILPQIQLEIGPIASWLPNEEREIRPYAAEKFPHLFSRSSTSVRTISAERTFWEKVTILHQEAHRSADRPQPLRYSRHYYDLYRLCRSPVREKALGSLDILEDVIRFKTRFYRCTWARYEDARPIRIKLLPPSHMAEALKTDYRSMQSMLFGTIPSFEEILSEIEKLEKDIHKLGSDKDGKN